MGSLQGTKSEHITLGISFRPHYAQRHLQAVVKAIIQGASKQGIVDDWIAHVNTWARIEKLQATYSEN